MTPEHIPDELHLGVSETKQNFSKLLNDVASGDSRVVVEKNGLKTAVIIDIASYRQLVALEARQREAERMFMEIGQRFADVPADVHEAEVEKAVAEARAYYRAKLVAGK